MPRCYGRRSRGALRITVRLGVLGAKMAKELHRKCWKRLLGASRGLVPHAVGEHAMTHSAAPQKWEPLMRGRPRGKGFSGIVRFPTPVREPSRILRERPAHGTGSLSISPFAPRSVVTRTWYTIPRRGATHAFRESNATIVAVSSRWNSPEASSDTRPRASWSKKLSKNF